MHNEGVREDNLVGFELIAWAAGHKAKGYHGPWPPGPYRAESVAVARNAYAADLRTPKAFNARSITSFGLRSPLAVTLTIAFAISSVIRSSRSVTPTSIKAAS